MIAKRIFKIASGLFWIPFGSVISIIYIIVSLTFFLEYPSVDHDAHTLTKHGANQIKEGIIG